MNVAPKATDQCFETSKGELLSFLKLAKPTAKNDSLPTGIIFGVQYGRLVAQVANRRTVLKQQLGSANYNEQNPIRANFKEVLPMVQGLDSDKVSIHWDNDRIYFDTANTRQTLYGSSDCQLLPFLGFSMVKFPSLAIVEAMPAVLKMIDDNAPRNYGTVARFTANKKELGFVGTDGYRLCLSHYPLGETDLTRFDGLTISKHQCETLLLAAKTNEQILLGISDDRTTLAFSMRNCAINFRTSSIEYPKYSDILPKAVRGQGFDVKPFLDMAKLALKTTGRDKTIQLSSDKGQLIIGSRSDAKQPWSEYRVSFHGAYDEKPIFINGKFLADCLSSTKSDLGMICINNGSSTVGMTKAESSKPDEPIKIILGSVETILMPCKGE